MPKEQGMRWWKRGRTGKKIRKNTDGIFKLMEELRVKDTAARDKEMLWMH